MFGGACSARVLDYIMYVRTVVQCCTLRTVGTLIALAPSGAGCWLAGADAGIGGGRRRGGMMGGGAAARQAAASARRAGVAQEVGCLCTSLIT
jgi:hypothetical protein